MFPRVTSAERAAIFRASKRILKGNFFDIRATRASDGVGRLFLVIPRAAGNAVKRNKIKRRARAVFHEYRMAACGYHLILFAKSGAAGVSFVELRAIFKAACQLLPEPFSLSL